MKKLKLIYNPFSGNKNFKSELDICIDIFQQNDFEVHLFRMMDHCNITEHILSLEKDSYDVFVVSGGDGTINIVLNAMMKKGITAPLGIIPSGTANDFANFIGLKAGRIEECCQIITSKEPILCDLGLVNDSLYFINVCAGGVLTNVSQIVDKELKKNFGRFSYYITGLEQISNFSKAPFRITTSKEVIEDDLFLYMILNSSGTGGFSKLAPQASIFDGQLDFIAIKGDHLIELSSIFLQVLAGDHIHNTNILHLTDTYFKVECLNPEATIAETTVDGEMGLSMPFEVRIIPKGIPIFMNTAKSFLK